MFAHHLALRLRMPVGMMLAQMSSVEFTRWQAFLSLQHDAREGRLPEQRAAALDAFADSLAERRALRAQAAADRRGAA